MEDYKILAKRKYIFSFFEIGNITCFYNKDFSYDFVAWMCKSRSNYNNLAIKSGHKKQFNM